MSLAQAASVERQYKVWNEGMTFIGVYHNIKYYTKDSKIHCLFGWRPKTFGSIKQFQHAVRKWENEDED